MRHEQIKETATYRKVEMAAWPSSLQPVPVLPAMQAEAPPQQATPSVPDVPAAVGKLIISSYVTMLGAFALATIASSYSVYMIAISALFLIAYFSIPWIFLRQERSTGVSRPTFDRFMQEGMMTQTAIAVAPPFWSR